MLPPELANPFRRPPAVPLNPDTAGMVEDMLGKEARKAFEALDDESPKSRAKPTKPTEEEKAAIRQAEKRLLERSKEQFPTWRTIPLGKYKTADELINALEEGGFKINQSAREILGKITLSGSPTSVELVNVSIKDLGLDKQATTQEIYDRAEELGLSLCPPEVGPVLRLYYSDQPVNEQLRVATVPTTIYGVGLLVFGVEHDDVDGWLYTFNSRPDDFWYADYRWVFVRNKQK